MTQQQQQIPDSLDKQIHREATDHYDRRRRHARIVTGIAHWIVLVLSLLLIIFISYDTFVGIPFLSNKVYMNFQFGVCIIFMVDFFI